MPLLKDLKRHKLLLDTHVLIWLMQGNTVLSQPFRKAVNQSQDRDGILISAISIWEIGMLEEKGRIALGMDCFDWIDQMLSLPGMTLVPLSPRIAIQSSRLPGQPHGDPADRILLASAHEENAVLVTCDEKLLAYGHDRFINVYNPV